jgi:hypothetical protein
MNWTRTIFCIALLYLLPGLALGQTHFDQVPDESQGMRAGPEVGSVVPDFRLADQHGAMRDFSSVAGSKGALILFYRSANW